MKIHAQMRTHEPQTRAVAIKRARARLHFVRAHLCMDLHEL